MLKTEILKAVITNKSEKQLLFPHFSFQHFRFFLCTHFVPVNSQMPFRIRDLQA